MKSLPVGIVCAIWAAVGVALVAILGKIMFNDPVPRSRS
jgi:multidrug transporter EmrE-like cation transporter